MEKDSMGPVRVPKDMLYGASTQRAVLNFPISGRRFPRPFIQALGQVKLSAAKANLKLGLLDTKQAGAMIRAAQDVRDGEYDAHFVVDVFQTGSGTSTNMNANEVIASLANRGLGLMPQAKGRIHPNDHVNKGQSSNDVIPSVMHIAVLMQIKSALVPELRQLRKALDQKARAFKAILKIGRTHLQDATPVTLGQEFGGYAMQIGKAIERLERCYPGLRELAIGGTAVGTGINTHPEFAQTVCQDLNQTLGENFCEAPNHFEAQAAKDACVETSAQLRGLAVALMKIANDIRWLGSGPRAGLGEIRLPAVQPGSSMMPGKVNPVIAEAVMQVAAEVIGNDSAVALAGLSGNFELNVMMPLMAYLLLESIRILTHAVLVFRTRCIAGIRANNKVCEGLIERNLMLATALVPVLGYDKAAAVAKEAYQKGLTVREVVRIKKLIPEKQLSKLLDVKRLISH